MNGAQLRSSDTVGEARDPGNGNLVHVWRSNSNDSIWVALNNGSPIPLPTARTNVAPRVARYGGHFHVVHTGTDGRIYEMPLVFSGSTTLAPSQPDAWTALPNQAVTRSWLSPSVVALRNNQAMLSWGSASDNSQWTMFFDGTRWQSPSQVPDDQSTTANNLAYDQHDDEIFMTHLGTDRHPYIQYQEYGNGQWSSPQLIPDISGTSTPNLVFTVDGSAIMLVPAGDSSVTAHHYGGTGLSSWSSPSVENTYRRPLTNPWLSVVGSLIFMILTDYSTHDVYYKQLAELD
ncbi:hypothetical protein ACFRKE_29880 [Kitasatospora indigofera]|uniref:hypothetical protein n=1 Tax=Kitasatospora indigofera TaxID=67307 RepID=UPI0036998D84